MNNSLALVPLHDLETMADHIVRSKLFGAKDQSTAMALMLLAQAEGLHPMTAVQDFDIVNGKPARKSGSILARFQQAGGTVAWEVVDATRAAGTFSHKQGGSLRVEWTIQQAQAIGLTSKDTWKNYPQSMLRSRVITEGVRAVYPAAIGGGILSTDEAQDLPPPTERDMGRADVVVKPETQGLPPYSDEKFAKNLPGWRAAFADGKTPADLIVMLSSKYVLSDVQLAEINKPLDQVMAEQQTGGAAA